MKPAQKNPPPANENASNMDVVGTTNQSKGVKEPTVPHQEPPYLPSRAPPPFRPATLDDSKELDPSRKPQPPHQGTPHHRPRVDPAPPNVPHPDDGPPRGGPPRPADRAVSGMQVDSLGPETQRPRPPPPRTPYPGVLPPPPQALPPHGVGGTRRELRAADALMYLDDVKGEFVDTPRIYHELIDILKKCNNGRLDTPGVMNQVARLFRGHNNLILGFNRFLPHGYHISLEDLERRDVEYARQQSLKE